MLPVYHGYWERFYSKMRLNDRWKAFKYNNFVSWIRIINLQRVKLDRTLPFFHLWVQLKTVQKTQHHFTKRRIDEGTRNVRPAFETKTSIKKIFLHNFLQHFLWNRKINKFKTVYIQSNDRFQCLLTWKIRCFNWRCDFKSQRIILLTLFQKW